MKLQAETILKWHPVTGLIFFVNVVFSFLYWICFEYLSFVHTLFVLLAKYAPAVSEFLSSTPFIARMHADLLHAGRSADIPFFHDLILANNFLFSIAAIPFVLLNMLDRNGVIIAFARPAFQEMSLVAAAGILLGAGLLAYMAFTGRFLAPSLTAVVLVEGRALAVMIGLAFTVLGLCCIRTLMMVRVYLSDRFFKSKADSRHRRG